MMKKLIYTTVLLAHFLVNGLAHAFVVKRIEIEGLQRISPATVESYLPVQRGQQLYPAKTAAILRALYKTGFFSKIFLTEKVNTLVIHVVERPTIGKLKIAGNSVIPTDKLTSVMKNLEVAEGRVYNPAVLENIKKSLLNQYYQLGRYNARVTITVTSMERNRVFVNIDISEGLVSKVRRISIIGNHAFDETTLVKQLEVTTPGLLTIITQTDRYSEERLEASLDKLKTFYLDHGYVHFMVKSSQAEVSPDRKSVYLSIVIDEGEPYTIKGYELRGKMALPRETLMQQMLIKPGDVFSRKKVIDSESSISKLLGKQGYLFAAISLQPKIDDKKREVYLTFEINAGKRTYLRHVTFSENNKTNDVVLRREVVQLESAPVSTAKLEDSKHRLSLLPYIRDVEMSVQPVAGSNDQVDVNYKVKEDSSAQAMFKVGYRQLDRLLLGAGLNQKNFLGTGNTLGINVTHSKYEQTYGIDYTNPYYTDDGISRTFNLSVFRVDPRGAGVNNGYYTNEYDLGVMYGIPLSQSNNVFSRLQAGASYQDTVVYTIPNNMSNQITSYLNGHGRHFQELDLRVGYSRDSRDKAIFATSGVFQTLYLDVYAPVAKNSVSFYTLNYHAKAYQPLTDQFILSARANLGFGSGIHGSQDFPFFKNYYAGGIDSVRGYQGYGLGPKDSRFHPMGGNALIDGSLGLIFPNFISDNLRTSAFIDAGNVYSTGSNRKFGCSPAANGQTTCSTSSGPLRYSVGIEADVLVPSFGPVQVSLAQPLNRRPHDERETFQFSLGANF